MAVQAWVDDLVKHINMDPEASQEDLTMSFWEYSKDLLEKDPPLREDLQLLRMLMNFEAGKVLNEFAKYLEIEGFFRPTHGHCLGTYTKLVKKAIDETMKAIETSPKPEEPAHPVGGPEESGPADGAPDDPADGPAGGPDCLVKRPLGGSSSSAGPVAGPSSEPGPSAPTKARKGSSALQDLLP